MSESLTKRMTVEDGQSNVRRTLRWNLGESRDVEVSGSEVRGHGRRGHAVCQKNFEASSGFVSLRTDENKTSEYSLI